ncbi:MAG: LPXTG cell wall anchor domain-containing protein [Methanophagales archaeon]|nr:LPXTG cell wall anchor domain-containing protein [Methanophagales archaeon]
MNEKALVVGAVAIIALMVGVMGFILKKRRR